MKYLLCLAAGTLLIFTLSCNNTMDNCEPAIDLPTAFSPNGDGEKDVLTGEFTEMKDWKFQVQNRWGKVVHRSTNGVELWAGEDGNQPAEIGNYIYKIEGIDHCGNTFNKSGNLTLVR